MERERAIITGVNGFVGHHLAKELSDNDMEVIGLGNDTQLSEKNLDNVAEYISVNLTEKWPEVPDSSAVIHLAGLAAVGPSFSNPQKYIETNSAMVTNMCEYYLKQENSPRIILVSSGAVYDSSQPMPLTEDSQIAHNSPYAVSKVLNESQAAYYRSRGLDVVVARPFNHTGPGQAEGFLLPDMTKAILHSRDNGKVLGVGNLDTRRDYTDVRDVARAYRLLAVTRKLGAVTYNICSGRSVSGKELLDTIKEKLDCHDIELFVDESKIRPNDPEDIYGDYSKLKEDTGWSPTFNIRQTVSDYIDSAS